MAHVEMMSILGYVDKILAYHIKNLFDSDNS